MKYQFTLVFYLISFKYNNAFYELVKLIEKLVEVIEHLLSTSLRVLTEYCV